MTKILVLGSIAMLDYPTQRYRPSADELLDSDETPVDNELQELIPALLKSILLMLWEERQDWLFAIDIGIYTLFVKAQAQTQI
jgi:Uma2 family endonuclease